MPLELKMELHDCQYRYVEGPGEAESPQWRIIIKLCMLCKSTFHDSTVQLLAKNLSLAHKLKYYYCSSFMHANSIPIFLRHIHKLVSTLVLVVQLCETSLICTSTTLLQEVTD